MDARYLVVISEADPVAPRVAAEWGPLPASEEHVDGAVVRQLSERVVVVHRPTLHLHDERLDLRLPAALRDRAPTLVFPSVHRSLENVECLTVHPLGNLGPAADLGGRPRTVDPTDPRAMTSVLRRLSEEGAGAGHRATFEATHHGPELGLPAFFVEIGYGRSVAPPASAVRILARALRELEPEPGDRVVVGVGGGHYAPHFTSLALERHWAFGHIVSRHSLEGLDPATARAAYRATPGAEGILLARASDADHPSLANLAPRRRDGEADRRARGGTKPRSSAGARASGT